MSDDEPESLSIPTTKRSSTPAGDFFRWMQKRQVPAGERSVEAWGAETGFGRDSAIVLAERLAQAGYLAQEGTALDRRRWSLAEGATCPPESITRGGVDRRSNRSFPKISQELAGQRRQTLLQSRPRGARRDAATEDPTSTSARVLGATSSEEPRTLAQIAQIAGLPISTARYALKKLIVAKDVLRRKKGEYVRGRSGGKAGA